ncbi:iron-containing alcohol dehydrogenase [Variovorax sp. PCZ-1]|uniref:iron-containing alcohol dehydrogenase n=1 Tax=Variovorax sp. PCZ-1 TaxID=2835533 RepID=UPI001BCFE410|nr:iron-containing alcohol dehydrogenase [Variovorax sp. PCZ-1]MBS7807321.1 iron-containing alcohol dehydrogenase [Variovorax sp. PCZ-1]
MAFIYYLTHIQFDHGAIKLLKSECERVGITRPMIVTDKGVRAAGIVDTAIAALGTQPAAIFDDVPSNPTEASVQAGLLAYRAGKCDGIIAVGGGSAIDCAKGISILVPQGGALKTYATIEGGSPLISDKIAPIIAVPTTSGTGSEVARGAIIIVEDGRKLGFHSWHLVPKAAICDPQLTLGLPAGLTAATGMDAIAHCIEAFLAPLFNPPADGIALDGLRRGWAHIERATKNGADAEARFQLMSASMQGAMAFQKGLGCVHSLSHSLGGVNPRLHHGTLNAMFLPAVVRYNSAAESVRKEDRLNRMAQAMNLSSGSDVAPALQDMVHRLGLPKGLSEMSVTTDLYEKIIDGAMVDHCHKLNPRIATREEYADMLSESMKL